MALTKRILNDSDEIRGFEMAMTNKEDLKWH